MKYPNRLITDISTRLCVPFELKYVHFNNPDSIIKTRTLRNIEVNKFICLRYIL